MRYRAEIAPVVKPSANRHRQSHMVVKYRSCSHIALVFPVIVICSRPTSILFVAQG